LQFWLVHELEFILVADKVVQELTRNAELLNFTWMVNPILQSTIKLWLYEEDFVDFNSFITFQEEDLVPLENTTIWDIMAT
jgi:hypothetical protein